MGQTMTEREIEAAVKAGKLSKEDAEKKLTTMLEEMFPGKKNDKQADPKSPQLKDQKGEVKRLLKRLRNPNDRKAFEDWFKNNGIDEDTLEKLRSMVEGHNDADEIFDEDKIDDKEKTEDPGKCQSRDEPRQT